jgi:hypothetical protein
MAKVKDVVSYLNNLDPNQDILSVVFTREEFDEWTGHSVSTQSNLVWQHYLLNKVDGEDSDVKTEGPASHWKELQCDTDGVLPFNWEYYVEDLELMHYEVHIWPSNGAPSEVTAQQEQDFIDEIVSKLITKYDDVQEFESEANDRFNEEQGLSFLNAPKPWFKEKL